MLNDQDQIIRNLKRLHMPTIRRSYEEAADRARSESWSYEQYLLQLLNSECEVRWQNRISRNLRASGLPPSKTLENFERKRLPARVDNHLNVLANGSFLGRCEKEVLWGLLFPFEFDRWQD